MWYFIHGAGQRTLFLRRTKINLYEIRIRKKRIALKPNGSVEQMLKTLILTYITYANAFIYECMTY